MWHLFKNNQKLFEFAFISKGEYIAGTRQGYENRSDALSALNHLARKSIIYYGSILVQDDTGKEPIVIALFPRERQVMTKNKPSKPYTV